MLIITYGLIFLEEVSGTRQGPVPAAARFDSASPQNKGSPGLHRLGLSVYKY